MGQPIAYAVPARNVREELREKVEAAPVEHAEAVLAAFDLLQKLHEQGVLDILRGAVGAKDDLLRTLVKTAQEPAAAKGLRNVLVLVNALGSVEPDMLHGLVRAVPEALEHMKSEPKVPGLFGLLRHFASAEMRRGVVFVNSVLEAMGRNIGRWDGGEKK